MKRPFVLDPGSPQFELARASLLRHLGDRLRAGQVTSVVVGDPARSLAQNARMWAVLHDIARQVGYRKPRWRGDRLVEEGGYVAFEIEPRAIALTPEEWKDVLSAALWRPRRLPGLEGGVVAVGLRTSSLTKRQMSDLIELAHAFGAEHGVRWSEPPAVEEAA
ncbi:recombination protein NinB [Coralloluteibacterium thermophilus]|uniref:Recombination protein NinB n=1 Tax=Coralloluteibacterium thermophilum TaxID=2707049 RepID=A0ABV9NGT2_9GAMM